MLSITFLLLVLAVSSFVAIQPVSAEAVKIEFTGSRIGPGVVVNPGTSWTAGPTTQVRDLRYKQYEDADNPLVDGYITRVINIRSFPGRNTQLWGTFVLEIDAEARWEGTWTGTNYVDDGRHVHHHVGHGTGDLEGYTIRYTLVGFPGVPPTISGFILMPHGE